MNAATPSSAPPEPLKDIALTVADHIPGMLAYWDREQRCRFANHAYLAWFGRTREQMLGITLKELLGPIYARNLSYIEGALAGVPQHFEREIPRPDGLGVRHSIATYIPYLVDGQVQGFFVHVADATALKNAERQLAQERDALAQSVEVLNRFGAILAHDFKAPLRGIAQMTERLLRSLPQPVAPETLEYAGFIRGEVARLTAMTDGVLRLAKIRVARAQKSECDLTALAQATVAALKPVIDARGAVVTVERLPRVACDAGMISSLLQNLIENALKYADRAQPQVRVHAEQDISAVTLIVDDNGPGIPPEQRVAAFAPFRRLTVEGEGLGLGLSLCEAIAQAHGARIWIEAAPEGGASFRVRFPRAP